MSGRILFILQSSFPDEKKYQLSYDIYHFAYMPYVADIQAHNLKCNIEKSIAC